MTQHFDHSIKFTIRMPVDSGKIVLIKLCTYISAGRYPCLQWMNGQKGLNEYIKKCVKLVIFITIVFIIIYLMIFLSC